MCQTHVFAHNRYVPHFPMINTSPWLLPQGNKDSERLFCHLLGLLEPLWSNGGIPAFEKKATLPGQS